MEHNDISKGAEAYASLSIFYHYRVNSYFAIETGYTNANKIDDVKQLDLSPGERYIDDFDFSYFFIKANTEYVFNQNNSVFFDLGITQYKYQIGLDNHSRKKDDGIGAIAAIGWRYQFDNGFSTSLAIQQSKMDDFSAEGAQLSLRYSF